MKNTILDLTYNEKIVLNEVLLHAIDKNEFNIEYRKIVEDLLNKIEIEI